MNYGVLDVGGSKIKSAVVSADNEVLFSDVIPTPLTKKDFFVGVSGLIESLKKKSGSITAMAIGVPGLFDYKKEVIISCPNIKFEIEKPQEDFPIFFANDADLALMGEIALRGLEGKSVALLTLGTGTGGAFSIAGKNPDDFAYSGEVGHMKIVANGRECSCFGKGCLEAYSSGRVILSQATKTISSDIKSVHEVCILAENGDQEAKKIIVQAARMLGVAVANLVNILGVEQIFLAGQIAKSSHLFLDEMVKSAKENIYLINDRFFSIEPSQNIDEVALIGGAVFAKRKILEK